MNKANKIISTVLNFLIIVSFSILILSCILQVFTRFILNSSLSWTEELARYSFIWANMLGAILCTKNKTNAVVTIITDNVTHSKKIKLQIITNILSIIIGIIIFYFGIRVAYAVRTQLSPALRISNLFIYGAAPVFAALLIFYSIYDLYVLAIERKEV